MVTTATARPATHFKGDKAEYTGKVESLHGGTFYEVELMEGHLAGAARLVVTKPADMTVYQLPHGERVLVPYDVCKAASVITYTLKGGRIVDAVIVQGER